MKKNKTPSLVTIAILTTITVAVWITYSVYRVLTSKPEPSIPKEILEPFTASFNSKEIDKLQEKLYFAKEQTEGLPISSSLTPSPSSIPVASPSATPLLSPTPTPTPNEESGANVTGGE